MRHEPKSKTGVHGSSIVSARRLTTNIGWNLLGTILPLIGLLVATPIIVDSLGLQALGLVSVSWAAIGYFALLDLGLGRTIAHFASRTIGDGRSERLRPLVVTTNAALFALGIGFGLILFISSAWIAEAITEDAVRSTADIANAIKILSLAVPFVVVGTGFRGLLQAFQRFGTINIVRVPVATATYVAPALTAAVTGSLIATTIALVLVRATGSIALGFASRGLAPPGKGPKRLSIRESIAVMKYGGWLTVSSIISPILSYLDKALVVGIVSLSAAAYYSTSFDVASKLLILPASVATVAFPALSLTLSGDATSERSGRIYRGTTFLSLMMLIAGGALLSASASSGLSIWLGDDFARNATTVLVLLVAASVVNGIAQAPYGLIQAAGRPDITAKLHMLEAPVYIVAAFLLVSAYGIVGAAIAWGLRITVDAVALAWFSGRFLAGDGARRYAVVSLVLLAPVAIILTSLPPTMVLRSMVAIVFTSIVGVLAWRVLLLPTDRGQVVELARSSISSENSSSTSARRPQDAGDADHEKPIDRSRHPQE